MLSKVKNTYIEVNYTQIIANIARLILNGGSGGDKIYTWVATTSGTFTITFTFEGSNSASGTFYASVNGENKATQSVRNGTTATLTFSCNEGDTVRLGISGVNTSYYLYNSTAGDLTQTKLFISTPIGILPILPQKIDNIGDLAVCTLYGIHKNDNKFYGGIITGTNTVVITGSIAPGNFVGYLEVNYNGSIVKVPYYN